MSTGSETHAEVELEPVEKSGEEHLDSRHYRAVESFGPDQSLLPRLADGRPQATPSLL